MRRLRRRVTRSRSNREIALSRVAPAQIHLRKIDRKALLLGTALASTLLAGVLYAPSAALAFPPGIPCSAPGPTQIFEYSNSAPIVCVNADTRIGDPFAIDLYTVGDGLFIDLNNSGTLHSTALGIVTSTNGYQAGIHIVNSGDITVSSLALHVGIGAFTASDNSPVAIENSAKISVATYGGAAFGIYGATRGYDRPVTIHNSGDIAVSATSPFAAAYGISASAQYGAVNIINSGNITATGGPPFQRAIGISAQTVFGNIAIFKCGHIVLLRDRDAQHLWQYPHREQRTPEGRGRRHLRHRSAGQFRHRQHRRYHGKRSWHSRLRRLRLLRRSRHLHHQRR